MMTDPDTKKSQRAFEAMMHVNKIDIAELKRAFAGKRCSARGSRSGVAGRPTSVAENVLRAVCVPVADGCKD